MEIRFRINGRPDGQFDVESATEPFHRLSSPWSRFGTFASLDIAASECANEIKYQAMRPADD